jgi:hypothetical protein
MRVREKERRREKSEQRWKILFDTGVVLQMFQIVRLRQKLRILVLI